MSNDTKWIIGTAVILGGLLSAQIAGVNARFDDLSTRIDDLRTDLTARIGDLRAELTTRMDRLERRIEGRMDGIDERLRAVEIALARVDQRLLTIERVVLPAPEPPPQ